MNSITQGSQWWKSDKNSIEDEIFAYVNTLDKNQSQTSNNNLKHARLYGNYDISGLDAFSYTKVDVGTSGGHRVTMNIIQNMVDTVVSKITKNKPRPLFLTEGGNWSLQRKAKKLTKFVDGIYNSMKFYEKTSKAFLDACIFGTGCIKFFVEDGNIKCEKVFIEEIKVDDVESFYGKPRQMHQVKHVHKDVLKEMFPKKAVLIDKIADDGSNYSVSNTLKSKQMIKVIESWHLPSGKDAKDGRHVIVATDTLLLDEDYTKDYFPFLFFRWNDRPLGFFGQGIAEQLVGVQLEINKILRTIQVAMHLVSIPKILVEASSKIVSSHINNKIGGIIKYAGSKPDSMTLGQISPDLFNHLDRLYNRSYEVVGVSQLAAQSIKPAGVESGKALRTLTDIESERFLDSSRRFENCFMDAAEIIIDMARDLYTNDEDFSVKVKGKKFIETIKWSEVDMENDKFMMDIFPTSALSQDPAGRLADIQDLISAGFIGEDEGRRLLDFPDLEGTMNMLNADSNNLERIIDEMMDKGNYIHPEPYQNLENAIRKVQQAYLMYSVEGAPDDRLELLRQYMEDAQGLIEKANQPSQAELAQQMAQQGAPGVAQVVAENANLGAEPLNPLIEGTVPLAPEEEIAVQEADAELPIAPEGVVL